MALIMVAVFMIAMCIAMIEDERTRVKVYVHER